MNILLMNIRTARDFGNKAEEFGKPITRDQKNSLASFFALEIFDPRSRPTVTAGNDHYFRTRSLSVRLSFRNVRPHFSKPRKTKQLLRVVIATDRAVGLVEWIIDGIHVFHFFNRSSFPTKCEPIFLRRIQRLGFSHWLEYANYTGC